MKLEELKKINNHCYRKEDLIAIDLKISENQEPLDYPNTITIIREFIRTLNDYEQLQKENINLRKNKTIMKISNMIASGEIPKEVYDKYLSDCPIGFMDKNTLYNYLIEGNKDE